MLLKHCNQAGCNRSVPKGQAFCDEHAEQRHAEYVARIQQAEKHNRQPAMQQVAKSHLANYNAERRDPEANQFYHSKSWQGMRNYIYARDMATCQVCGNAVTDRKIVDHIHSLKSAPDEKLSKDNLWVLCYRCHANKTNLEQSMSGNQLKHVSRKWWTKVLKERVR